MNSASKYMLWVVAMLAIYLQLFLAFKASAQPPHDPNEAEMQCSTDADCCAKYGCPDGHVLDSTLSDGYRYCYESRKPGIQWTIGYTLVCHEWVPSMQKWIKESFEIKPEQET